MKVPYRDTSGQRAEPLQNPRSIAELRGWIAQRLTLNRQREDDLVRAVESVLVRQRQLMEQSKEEALRALAEGFSSKLDRLQAQLSERDVAVSNIARYFEDIVAELTEKSHRDPKTKLLNAAWFMERLETFLGAEQRVRWCAVGVVDIASFKWYNDTLGHPLGDRIIERVAQLLADQIRSADVLALERAGAHDLHARFGGDEFCFLIPDLPGCAEASTIAQRFKHSVETHEWTREDPRLSAKPVCVDVGVVCLRLGPLTERRGIAHQLATELLHRADALMYEAKARRSARVHASAVRIIDRALVETEPSHGWGDQSDGDQV